MGHEGFTLCYQILKATDVATAVALAFAEIEKIKGVKVSGRMGISDLLGKEARVASIAIEAVHEHQDGLGSVSLVDEVVVELEALVLHGVLIGIRHRSHLAFCLHLRRGDQLCQVLSSLVLLDALKQFLVTFVMGTNHLI